MTTMDADGDSMYDYALESEPESEDEANSSDRSDDDLGIEMMDEDGSGSSHSYSGGSHKDAQWKPEVLTPTQIMTFMMDIIQDVSSVIQVPATTARVLLTHFKWDRQKLLELYYDVDRDRLFKEAHIVRQISDDSQVATTSSEIEISEPVITESCEICFLDVPSNLKSGLDCDHKFCKDCWNQYLTSKIMNDGMGPSIGCPAYQCGIVVDDETVKKNIVDNIVWLRYQKHIINGFVLGHRRMAWCPFPDCANAVRVQSVEFKPVVCSCGCCFCFICGQEWHAPISCKYWKMWLKKCADDSATCKWIVVNTKECPKCHVNIEKNGGCNYISCSRESCKIFFCWVCLQYDKSNPHFEHSCNYYHAVDGKAKDAVERSQAELTRYLFYYDRYANHIQSMKLEKKLHHNLELQMVEMQEHDVAWIDIQYLRQAVAVLCQSRRTLMHSYAFAYYVVKNNQSILFEDNQKDLEMATEVLSAYLENDLNWENVTEIKPKVVDQYRYCESRRNVLLDHCREAQEKNLWTFTDNDD